MVLRGNLPFLYPWMYEIQNQLDVTTLRVALSQQAVDSPAINFITPPLGVQDDDLVRMERNCRSCNESVFPRSAILMFVEVSNT